MDLHRNEIVQAADFTFFARLLCANGVLIFSIGGSVSVILAKFLKSRVILTSCFTKNFQNEMRDILDKFLSAFFSSFFGEVKTRTNARVLLHRWPPFFTHLLLLTQSTVFQNFSKSIVPCFLLGIAFRVFPTQSIPHSRWDAMTDAEMELGAPEALLSLSLLPVFFSPVLDIPGMIYAEFYNVQRYRCVIGV